MKILSSRRFLSFRFPLSRAARTGALFLLLLVGLSAAQPCSADDGGTLVVARISHTATLLANGHVLLAGGRRQSLGSVLKASELYDPETNVWMATGDLHQERLIHTACLLPDGRVLVAGGINHYNTWLDSAEIYNPASGHWTYTGRMNVPHAFCEMVLLPTLTKRRNAAVCFAPWVIGE